MAKIICIVSGFSGILNGSFELARRLTREGHTVSIGSLIDRKAKIKEAGFTNLSLAKWYEEPAFRSSSGKGRLSRLAASFGAKLQKQKRLREGIRNLGQERFKEILAQEQPDILLIDCECREYVMTALTSQTPLLLLSQWFNGIELPGIPPLTSGIIYGEDGADVLIESAWADRKALLKKMEIKNQSRFGGLDRRSLLLAYAQQVGFPEDHLDFFGWPGPFAFKDLPIAHFTLAELEFPHESLPNHHYVGPMVYRGDEDSPVETSSLDSDLAAIVQEGKSLNKKLVYCSLSTMAGEGGNFLHRLISACASRADWTLLIAMGGHSDQLAGVDLPDGVYAYDWLPQSELLEFADCCINHAGINTINDCIVNKVPMLIYSGGKYDQDGCAARMAYHGLALLGDRASDDATAIASKLETVMKSEEIQHQINTVYDLALKPHYQDRLSILVEEILSVSGEQRQP